MPDPNPADPIRDRRHIILIKSHLKAQAKKGWQIKFLFFTLGINSGLRVSDMLGLTASDLWNPDVSAKASFTIKATKTGKRDDTHINEAISQAMRIVEPVLFPHGFDPDVVLFPIRRETASRWVKKWCHEVGLDEGNYSAHTLRKTYAYHQWVDNGKNEAALITVSKDLGHKSVGTTYDYLGLTRKDIAQSQRRLNL